MADKKISALTAATTPLAGTEVLPIVQSASTVKVAVNDMLGVTSWTSPAVNSEGNMFLRATDTLGTGVGTQIGLGGKYNASSYFPFAAVAGRKENATNNNVAGYLAFLTTTSGGTLTERARFNSTGNLAFSTAGNGIDFSANTHAAGMTSELLNDYEEGTWTPTDGSGAGLTFTGTSGNCFYTKVGNLVTCVFGLVYPTTADLSGAKLAGLPFTSKATSNSVSGGFITYTNSALTITPLVGTNDTGVNLFLNTGTAAGNNQLSTFILRGIITYMV
jgi:hypothetical protein